MKDRFIKLIIIMLSFAFNVYGVVVNTNLIQLAENAYARKDYRNSIKFFENVIETSPILKAEYYEKLSNAYMYLNDYTNMLKVSRAGILFFRSSSTLYFNKGYAIYKLGDASRAIPPIENAIVLNPTSGYMHNYIGLLYLYQSNYSKAQVSFLKATVYSPTNVTYLVNLGASYERDVNYREALQIYEKAVTMEPNYRGLKNSINRAKYHLYGGTNSYMVSDNEEKNLIDNNNNDVNLNEVSKVDK